MKNSKAESKTARERGEIEARQNGKLTKVSATQNCNQRTPEKAIRTTATGERGNRAIMNAINP